MSIYKRREPGRGRPRGEPLSEEKKAAIKAKLKAKNEKAAAEARGHYADVCTVRDVGVKVEGGDSLPVRPFHADQLPEPESPRPRGGLRRI